MTGDTRISMGSSGADSREIRVWDLLVRTGHWLLVALFIIAQVTEDDLLTLHSWAGYGIGAYIIVRVIWGFVGPKYARFSDFAHGPKSALRYLGDLVRFRAKRYLGHSPAGGAMVFALLISLTMTVVTGVALLAVEENAGPLAPWFGRGAALERVMPDLAKAANVIVAPANASENDEDNGDGGEVFEEIHEFFSNLTLLLVFAHIAGVVLASLAHRENLARAMITGRKRAE